jgi:TolB protein
MRRQLLILVSLVTLASHVAFAQPPSAKPATGAAEPSIEAKHLTNIRQITRGMARAGEGYFSPDGKTIVYQAQPLDYPFYQIFTQALEGGTPHRISTGRGRTTCAYFSPDGKKILFASSHLDPKMTETEDTERKTQEENKKAGRRPKYSWDFDPYMDLFEADKQGNILKRLTDAKGYDAEGAYSKDGKLIAFCSDRDGDPDLYVMNSDGSGLRQLTDAPGYDGGPFISPDGKWVIFRSDRKLAEHLQIHVIGIDGKNDTALTDINGVCWAPYWHPSQPYIIWTGADHSNLGPMTRPNYDLWLAKYEVEGDKFTIGTPLRITDSASADVLPVFSPDGKQLMWTSTRSEDHTSQLFVADFALPK